MPRPSAASPLMLSYPVTPVYDRWALDDEKPVPVSNAHREATQGVEAQLKPWARRHRPRALVGGELAIRWDKAHPQMGVDPDVYLVDPAPPEGRAVRSLLLWKAGHSAPQMALEVVSPSNPKKDYAEVPDKYAACGVGELWVFDPELAGPAVGGGPHRLQVWRRDGRGRFRRVYAGQGPGYSRFVRAWLVPTEGGQFLRLADDAEGRSPWLTDKEAAERQAQAAERQAQAAEQQAEAERLARIQADAKAEAAERRLADDRAEGLRAAVADLCDVLGVALGPKRRARLDAMNVAELDALRAALKRQRRWPGRP